MALALLLLLAWAPTAALAQLTGTKSIPGNYATLAAAITDLNASGVGAGGVTLNLVAGNPQTAPSGGYSITTLTGSAANPIVLLGNGNTITASAAQTAGALNDAIFKVIGSDFVTINGFTMAENAANTTSADGTNNMTEWGVAVLYASTTDGAQNVTISNNTISLNRTYRNTFGIYSNSRHSAGAPTTGADASSAAGANSGLTIRGNSIANVNLGIVVIGAAAAAAQNQGLDIGGSSAATGNTVTNFGTTGTFASYFGVATGVSGILVSNTTAYNVSFNTIQSSNGGTTSGTLRGVYVPAFANAPTGTFTDKIDDNSVSLRSGNGSAVLGITVESTTANSTTTIEIDNNDFNTSGRTSASSSAFTFLTQHAAALVTDINGNTFSNLALDSVGDVILIDNTIARPAGATVTVNSNAIVGTFGKTGSGGVLSFYRNTATSPATVTETNNGNTFANVTVAGTTIVDGWVSQDASRKTVSNNTFGNISGGSGAVAALQVGRSDSAFAGNNVNGNVVSALSGSGSVTGIASPGRLASFGGSQNLSGNVVHALSSTGAAPVAGIQIGAGTTQKVSANEVYDLEATDANGSVSGIDVGDGSTIQVYDNLVGDLRTPAANASNPLNGIRLSFLTTTPTFDVAFNTILLNASSSGATFGSSGVFAPSSSNVVGVLTLRDNVIVNTSTPAGTGVSAAFRRSGTAVNNYASASNNNLFYAGAPSSGHVIFTDGTNSDATLAEFQARVAPRESASVTDNPPFLSTNGADATFLHIDPTAVTQLESGGIPVSGVTTDFDGDARNATTPDIGADEFDGPIPPSISYTPLHDTTLGTNRVLSATITDADGVATGANAPRIYFRKNALTYFSTQCAGSSPDYSCTIDNALVGGVATGDVIDYFVIAQDSTGHVVSKPRAGLAASDVNTVATPPSPTPAYTVVLAVPASLNVGVGQSVTSLTNPGGLFDAINKGVMTSSVTASVTSDLLAETGSVSLKPFIEEGVGGYSLTIQPAGGAPRSIVGNNATALVDFNGASRVTVNGLNTGGNSLLIRNTAGSTARTIRFLNDAANDSVLNCTIESGGSVGGYGISVDDPAVTGNNNIQILGNVVRDRSDAVVGAPFNGIASGNNSPAVTNKSLIIADNTISNFNTAGILLRGVEDVTVMGNDILQTRAQTTQLYGILLQSALGTNLVEQNLIHEFSTSVAASGIELDDVAATLVSRNHIWNFQSAIGATGTLTGIAFSGSSTHPAEVEIVNNMVSIAPAFTTTQSVIGIVDSGQAGNTFAAYFNSIYIGGTGSGNGPSWALLRDTSAPTGYTARDNLAFNNRASQGVNHFGGGDDSANTGTFDSDFNFFAGTGANAASFMDYGIFANSPVTFVNWQAGPPPRDANSIANTAASFAVADYFVDAAGGDLHLLPTAAAVIGAGTPVVGVTTDFDGAARPASAPNIGADQIDDIFGDNFELGP